MPDAPPAVQAAGVGRRFGSDVALDRVDLVVRPGSVHGLLGPNGAGKTTLLSVLLGLVPADVGTVRLFGRTRDAAGARWLDGVGGFVATPGFYPYLSGRRNLEILAGLDGDPDAPAAGELLDLVGLAGDADRRVRGYSTGMRQRLGLAAALARRPRLLVLDEPTSGIDPAGTDRVGAALRAFAADGGSVLLSSHDMTRVEEVCDEVTVLRAGRVVFAGDLDQMRAAAPRPQWRLRTGDDPAARARAGSCPGVRVSVTGSDHLVVEGDQADLDGYVLALGRAGIAVRELSLRTGALESLFAALTAADAARSDAARLVDA